MIPRFAQHNTHTLSKSIYRKACEILYINSLCEFPILLERKFLVFLGVVRMMFTITERHEQNFIQRFLTKMRLTEHSKTSVVDWPNWSSIKTKNPRCQKSSSLKKSKATTRQAFVLVSAHKILFKAHYKRNSDKSITLMKRWVLIMGHVWPWGMSDLMTW